MIGGEYGQTHRAIVREIVDDGVVVEIPTLAPNAEWGPVPATVPNLATGEAVLVTQISTSRDTLVVIGRVPGRAPTVSEILTLAATISALQTADTALQAADTALDGRLDTAEAALAGLSGHSHTTAASMTVSGNASVGDTLGVTGLATLVNLIVNGTFTANGTVADQPGIGGTRFRYQSAAQWRNNQTAFLSSDYLTFPVVANGIYSVESQLNYSATAVADVRFKFLLPAGSGSRLTTWGQDLGLSAYDDRISRYVFDNFFEFVVGGIGAGEKESCRPGGTLFVGPTAGTFVVQFAQNAAEVSWTYLELGSWVRLTRVA